MSRTVAKPVPVLSVLALTLVSANGLKRGSISSGAPSEHAPQTRNSPLPPLGRNSMAADYHLGSPPFDVDLVAGLDPKLIPNCFRDHDLAFGAHSISHT